MSSFEEKEQLNPEQLYSVLEEKIRKSIEEDRFTEYKKEFFDKFGEY